MCSGLCCLSQMETLKASFMDASVLEVSPKLCLKQIQEAKAQLLIRMFSLKSPSCDDSEAKIST